MIGVGASICDLNSLKRELLFFEKIVLYDVDPSDDRSDLVSWQSRYDEDCSDEMQKVDEIEYLISTPFFDGRSITDYPGILKPASTSNDLNSAIRDFEDFGKKLKRVLNREKVPNWFKDKESRISDDSMERITGVMMPYVDVNLRMEVAYQELLGNHPLQIIEPPILNRQNERGATPESVIQLALKKVMVPDDSVPWETIFDLKTDNELSERARKLCLWATDIAKPGMTLGLAEERLADALADYERYLIAHKIKFSSVTLRSVIVSTSELLEDVVKLRLGKLAGRFLSVRERYADMALSEARAPGRAVSLITVLNEKLARLAR